MLLWTGKDKFKHPFTRSLIISIIVGIVASISVYREYTKKGQLDSNLLYFLSFIFIGVVLAYLRYKIRANFVSLSGKKLYKRLILSFLGGFIVVLICVLILFLVQSRF